MSDEQLLNLMRTCADLTAQSEFYGRYINKHKSFAKCALPTILGYLDEWTLCDCYLDALKEAVDTYDEAKEAKFKTYLITIYHNFLAKETKRQSREVPVVSLDAMEDNLDGSTYSLSDSISCLADDKNSPVAHVNYEQLLSCIDSLTNSLKKNARRLVDLLSEGYNLKDACQQIPISYGKGRYIISKLYDLLIKNGLIEGKKK